MDKRQHKHKYRNGIPAPRKSIRLAQNFLTDPNVVRRLVEKACIRNTDTVIEIGAGRGIITAELSRQAIRVIAIEADKHLASKLRERFHAHNNVEIVTCDFFRYRLPTFEYKVFGSIPYNLTTAIVRKLLDRPRRAPVDAYLIMQRETARRLAGIPHETMFSVLAKTHFEFRIVHHLRPTDFHPVPDVDSVMLQISKRSEPLVDDVAGFREFVEYGFTSHKRNLRLAYARVFTYKQWKHLAHDIGFEINAIPTVLRAKHWVKLYEALYLLRDP